jgi:DNA-binding response OmpR family regulator
MPRILIVEDEPAIAELVALSKAKPDSTEEA